MSIQGYVNQPYTRAIAKMTCFVNDDVSVLRQTLALPPSDLALRFSNGPILSRALQLAYLFTYLDTNRSPIPILPDSQVLLLLGFPSEKIQIRVDLRKAHSIRVIQLEK